MTRLIALPAAILLALARWMPEALADDPVAVVVMSYVFFGGMRGTAWVNTVQTIMFLVFGTIAFIIIARGIGTGGGGCRTLIYQGSGSSGRRTATEGRAVESASETSAHSSPVRWAIRACWVRRTSPVAAFTRAS